MIRIIEGTLDPISGLFQRDITYRGTPILQIIEFKYSSDLQAEVIYEEILKKYEPLAQTIRTSGSWPHDVDIIPIVVGRVGTFHPKTVRSIYRLIYLKDKPPDDPTPRLLTKLLIDLRYHIQQWLCLCITASAKYLKPTHRKPHTKT